MGQVIAVAVAKGCVGKTAGAVNLNVVLANMGYRVALIDFETPLLSTKSNVTQVHRATLKNPWNACCYWPPGIFFNCL